MEIGRGNTGSIWLGDSIVSIVSIEQETINIVVPGSFDIYICFSCRIDHGVLRVPITPLLLWILSLLDCLNHRFRGNGEEFRTSENSSARGSFFAYNKI